MVGAWAWRVQVLYLIAPLRQRLGEHDAVLHTHLSDSVCVCVCVSGASHRDTKSSYTNGVCLQPAVNTPFLVSARVRGLPSWSCL